MLHQDLQSVVIEPWDQLDHHLQFSSWWQTKYENDWGRVCSCRQQKRPTVAELCRPKHGDKRRGRTDGADLTYYDHHRQWCRW